MSPVRRSILPLAALALVSASAARAQGAPRPPNGSASAVRCPAEYGAVYDSTARAVRCRRATLSWVVTACPDRDFATYVPRPGRDVCEPTPLPGVGAPPGPRLWRPIACASPGYTVVNDRTGVRDRCERVGEEWTDPRRPSG
jgi:hypothetical protein